MKIFTRNRIEEYPKRSEYLEYHAKIILDFSLDNTPFLLTILSIFQINRTFMIILFLNYPCAISNIDIILGKEGVFANLIYRWRNLPITKLTYCGFWASRRKVPIIK